MSDALRYTLLLHTAIALFFVLWRLSAWCEGAARRRSGAQRWATFGHLFLLAALSAPLLCAGLERLPATRRLLPGAPLAGVLLGENDGAAEGTRPAGRGVIADAPDAGAPRQHLAQALLLATWALGALGLALVRARQWRGVRALLAEAIPLRRAERVEVLVHERAVTPFATRVRGRASVVVPAFLVESGRWREAVRHELQHHRQGDARSVLAWDALTALLWINPAIWAWRRAVTELQELACDERVLERAGVDRGAYGETLIDVAEAVTLRPGSCCSSMVRRGRKGLLARRIDRIVDPSLLRRSSMVPRGAWMALCVGLWLGVAGAWAAGGGGTDPATADVRLRPALQQLVQEQLTAHLQRVGATRGVVVAMDPGTGAVLARAGARRDDATGRVIADDAAPFALAFPGASTLKTLVVAGALEARAIDGAETFDTGDGTLAVDGKTYREWKDGGLGRLSAADVLVKSSNIGALQIAQRAGAAPIAAFMKRLGLAVAPDATAAELCFGSDEHAAVTAWQLAYAYAAVANGGHDPRTGSAVVRSDVSSYVRAALARAVTEGTAVEARSARVVTAGKTGSAAHDANGVRTGTAYFVGFAPADAPRLVVSVIVDGVAGDANGNRHAAPLFRAIVEGSLR